jgi:hypothetical protein
MPEEEFIISAIKVEDENIIVSFSVSNIVERTNRLIQIAMVKWAKQYGKEIPMPENYKAQIIGQGIPPMIMRMPMVKWNNRGFQLNDRVIINVPETIDDIKPVMKKDFDV